MGLSRVEIGAVALAALVAVAAPFVLLRAPAGEASAPPAEPALLAPPVRPALSAVFARDLFAGGGAVVEDAPLPPDAPELVGIVGRIGSDAVALVRGASGTRTLAVGAGVDGWTLESLAIDAAYFTRGNQRVRVPLPAG